MSSPYKICTEVTPTCPVEATTYGYYPNLAASITFLTLWALLTLSQLVLGIRFKTWSYSAVLAAGSAMEAIGYGGRVIMHSNPWLDPGFRTQIVCLILAPTLLAAGVYLTVKHITLYYGSQYSRLRPKLYTWIFIGCDVASIVIQAVGGGLAASGPSTANIGNNIIVAGIAVQIATMLICGGFAVDFFLRMRKSKATASPLFQPEDQTASPPTSKEGAPERARTQNRGRIFLAAIAFAYLTILIRCIYRLPEMIGGWGNPRMRRENEFLICDGLMVLLATMAMTIFHPGWTFPRMMTKS